MKARYLLLILLLAFPAWADMSLWQPNPLVTSGQRTNSTPGGEGGQQIQFIATDASSSTTLLMGTDVGGLYVNYNGGACCWQPANVGYTCQGGESGTIDPNNSAHMLVAGCSSGSTTWAGIWQSTNAGQSWSRVLNLTSTNVDLYTTEFAYDPASLVSGQSTTVYFLPDNGSTAKGLYKSTNGGSTWAIINNTSQCCTLGGWVAVAPTGSDVYIANSLGFWQSTNGGTAFTETLANTTLTGLSVTPNAASNVYITENATGVFRSTTNGSSSSFSNVGTTGLVLTGGGLINGTVSPGSTNVLFVVTADGSGNEIPYYSVNAGANWATCVQTNTAGFLPAFQRNGTVVESYANTYTAFTNTSGDFVAKATYNGANTFLWKNDGYLGATFQSITNFNAANPLLMFMPTQDYNSAASSDGGQTWSWFNVSGTSFGFNYGGGAMFADTQHMFVGNTGTVGNPITLVNSVNGGGTWTNGAPSPITVSGSADLQNVACDCPGNTSTAFWNFWKTTNQGVSWVTIGSNVQGVFTYDYSNALTLYGVAGTGASGITIVKSGDNGGTWAAAATETLGAGFVIDVAYDWKNNILYAATNTGALVQWKAGTATNITSRLPTDAAGNQNVDTVCIDPINPNIVYTGFYTGLYNTNVAVCISRDAGATWKNLTMQAGDLGIDGGTGPMCVRVNRWTRQLYASGGVYGLYRLPPPVSDQTLIRRQRGHR
jgi:hypothetical protein